MSERMEGLIPWQWPRSRQRIETAEPVKYCLAASMGEAESTRTVIKHTLERGRYLVIRSKGTRFAACLHPTATTIPTWSNCKRNSALCVIVIRRRWSPARRSTNQAIQWRLRVSVTRWNRYREQCFPDKHWTKPGASSRKVPSVLVRFSIGIRRTKDFKKYWH